MEEKRSGRMRERRGKWSEGSQHSWHEAVCARPCSSTDGNRPSTSTAFARARTVRPCGGPLHSCLLIAPARHNGHVWQARPHPAADSRSGSLQEASRAPQHLRASLRGAPGNVFLGPLCLPRPPLLRLPQALPRPLASQRQPALRSLAAFLVEQEGGKGGEETGRKRWHIREGGRK